MGNTIVPVGNGGDERTSRWMKAAGIAIHEEHYRKMANAKDIDRRTYTSRQHQDYLKPKEVPIHFHVPTVYPVSQLPPDLSPSDSRFYVF
ncbi:hypothetical protein LC609_09245 [Nostoc sp. XA013]|nr:hypothetical protein [Nostoc sp. XA013]